MSIRFGLRPDRVPEPILRGPTMVLFIKPDGEILLGHRYTDWVHSDNSDEEFTGEPFDVENWQSNLCQELCAFLKNGEVSYERRTH